MEKMKITERRIRMKKLLSLLLLLCTLLCACQTPEAPAPQGPEIVGGNFDYMTSDLSPFIELPEALFSTLAITVSAIPEITDADAEEEFNGYFANGNYYREKAGDDTVDTGDLLYLSYHGVLLSKLEEAAAEGKIPDADCTGMTYSEILALSLGFEGGTTQSITGITIGSANYIAGFESGLVGASVSASGNENPVRLHLSFPENYGSAELAGKAVIFFCSLSYIGDKDAGLYDKDSITVERLNEMLGLADGRAYPSVAACLEEIKSGLVRSRENTLYNEKANALYTALASLATFPKLPDAALTDYVQSFLDSQVAELRNLYEQSPAYYSYYFGDEAPSEALVAAYYGYSRDNYMAEMKLDCVDAIKAELCYYYLLRYYDVTLSDDEIAASREKYIAMYGEGVFEGIEEEEITAQFLRDKITAGLLDYLEENGRITYQTTTS